MSAVEIEYRTDNDIHSGDKTDNMQENKDDPMAKTKCPSGGLTPPNENQSKVINIEVESDCSSQESGGKFSKLTSDKSQRPSQSNISQAKEAANKFFSTLSHPCFMVALSSFRPLNQSIPIDFVRKYMEGRTKEVILKVADKQWPVKLNIYLYRSSAGFSVGWSTFVKENSLKKRDVCIFERTKKNMLSVSIFRNGLVQ